MTARTRALLIRYNLRGQLQRTVVVYACILAIALSIDLSANVADVVATGPDEAAWDTAVRLARYAGLRSADITAHLLGISTFLGVLWWEVRQIQSRERLAVWNTGQSPVIGLVPALLFGVLLGSVQLALNLWLHPAAMTTQIDAGLGVLGKRYDRSLSDRFTWGVLGDRLLAARIDYGPPAVLHDMTLYRLTPDGRLQSIVKAKSATETTTPGIWKLERATRWYAKLSESDSPGQAVTQTQPPGGQQLALPLDPGLFRFHGMAAKYIPQGTLGALTKRGGPGFHVSDYKTWMQFRYAHGLLPVLMALLAASVALFAQAQVVPFTTFIVIFLSGYSAHVLMKVGASLGELGFLAPAAAAWTGPALIAGAVVLIQLHVANRVVDH